MFYRLAHAAETLLEDGPTEGVDIVKLFLSMLNLMKNVIIAVIILFAFYIIAKLFARYAIRSMRKTQGESLHEDVIVLVRRVITVGTMAIGFAIVAQYIFNFDFLQIIGFFGLGIGFAFKDLLSNLIAGVLILMQKRFSSGDFIQIGEGSLKGVIVEISMRSTILKSLEGTQIIVPNSDLLTKTVTSYTSNNERRIEVKVGVHYKTNLEMATTTILEVLRKEEEILENPEPVAIATEFGESAIVISVRFWVESRSSWINTRSRVIREIKKAFDSKDITIPFPIRTIEMTPADSLGGKEKENSSLSEKDMQILMIETSV